MVKVYDLVNAENGKHFSPFAWRVLMVLRHKNIKFEHIGLRFTQIKESIFKLTDGKWELVPVVEFDDGKVIYNSKDIIEHVEREYPENPIYPNGKNFSIFTHNYLNQFFPLFQLILFDCYKFLKNEDDKQYFRETREKYLECTLEEFGKDREESLNKAKKLLVPFTQVLKNSKFLEGDSVTYSDYLLYGHLKWVYLPSPDTFHALITENEDKALLTWFNSMETLYDNFGKSYN
ncbi:hypothetical protein K502DRAFT_295729 [Neoconidiobolus thromboides FSU 785]|nr:hypothetical protein K502DRAFT_295729 [Neoconidiobolus thromboides FSU 785]